MAHTMARGGMARETEEREREEQLMPWSAGPKGAYLPVILHVVAQADEAGLELLWPQCPAVVLPGVRGRRARGGVETTPTQRWGGGPGSHEEGWGEHRVRGDVDMVMAKDSWGRWKGVGGLRDSKRPPLRPLHQSRVGAEQCRLRTRAWRRGAPCLPGSGQEKGTTPPLAWDSRAEAAHT